MRLATLLGLLVAAGSVVYLNVLAMSALMQPAPSTLTSVSPTVPTFETPRPTLASSPAAPEPIAQTLAPCEGLRARVIVSSLHRSREWTRSCSREWTRSLRRG
jgi:hypothetical protein